jgi:macrodomain Ter protein organizer (MatP/YcbG family)
MKVTVYILDRRLRADGVKIAVFRQTHSADGWIDAQVNPDTATKLEDAILARARELRLATKTSD